MIREEKKEMYLCFILYIVQSNIDRSQIEEQKKKHIDGNSCISWYIGYERW